MEGQIRLGRSCRNVLHLYLGGTQSQALCQEQQYCPFLETFSVSIANVVEALSCCLVNNESDCG